MRTAQLLIPARQNNLYGVPGAPWHPRGFQIAALFHPRRNFGARAAASVAGLSLQHARGQRGRQALRIEPCSELTVGRRPLRQRISLQITASSSRIRAQKVSSNLQAEHRDGERCRIVRQREPGLEDRQWQMVIVLLQIREILPAAMAEIDRHMADLLRDDMALRDGMVRTRGRMQRADLVRRDGIGADCSAA